MKKFRVVLAVLIAMVMVMGGVAYAEYTFPGDGYNKGTMGTSKKPFRLLVGNTVVFPGTTYDAFETHLYAVDPTAYRVIALPNASGTVVLEDGSGSITLSGSDAQILIHNGTEYQATTVSGDVTITNAGVASIEAGTDGQMLIYNATEKWGPKTISGDVTITNAGVLSIGSNKVGTAEANINSVSLNVAAGTTWNGVAVESGSTLLGWYITTAGAINGSTFMNTVEWDGTTFKATISAADGGNDTILSGTFLRP
jgi:hypothetical protein